MDNIKVTFSHLTKLFMSKTKFLWMTQGFKKMHIIYQSKYSNYYFLLQLCLYYIYNILHRWQNHTKIIASICYDFSNVAIPWVYYIIFTSPNQKTNVGIEWRYFVTLLAGIMSCLCTYIVENHLALPFHSPLDHSVGPTWKCTSWKDNTNATQIS